MEVMGLMLGEFVDDYTVRVVDVFAMPQSGTGVSVEAVDPVFQTKMMDMLRQTGRRENRNWCAASAANTVSGPRRWWDGTIRIPVLDVGSHLSTSTPSNPSSNSRREPSLWLSTQYSP